MGGFEESEGGSCCSGFLDYETPKSVVVKSRGLGVAYRIGQMLILAYFIGYVFVYQKAYQATDIVSEVSIITKVKGVAAVGDVGTETRRVWDVAEYVSPAQGSSSFAIITNVHVTPEQTLGNCPEDGENKFAKCTNDTNCLPRHNDHLYSGEKTGRCVPFDKNVSTCEVNAWCPVEVEGKNMGKRLLRSAENFTILIKNNIRFPKFNVSKGNLPEDMDKNFLKSCHHHPKHNNLCPIFSLRDILKGAGQDFKSIGTNGGVLGVLIDWRCNFDFNASFCEPLYSFRRLDTVSKQNPVGSGYNFRFAKHYVFPNGTEHRTLIKAYGVRIDILVSGQAGRFDIIPTIINLVAALTSVGVASIICDWVLLNIMRQRSVYRQSKFEEVTSSQQCKSSMEFSPSPSQTVAVARVNGIPSSYPSSDDSIL
ncbi:P2X purinoceptor 4-like [Lethenteron reissneri]|uniref:P2X purinoceptor 4-like n=1 Tax=Lethenteron reissneri TaxID=7753 RepID=UPI002AB6B9EA|nr:P2X purinoceptor 4-like [Lethenteron reissneri]